MGKTFEGLSVGQSFFFGEEGVLGSADSGGLENHGG